ncbi:hypothetical protein L2E82_30130 [Cichorium intybus]|uniref:Uncharacterized protein n=1 Tax=Cichorium intybus TaxID=13427 RepID=A0ACB9CZG1_CICIN|nr:hypothetical protein L2E82_30130 [Cichorium intybus]
MKASKLLKCSFLLDLLLMEAFCICITTSTSAGLEQILPWMFYHKVIGVGTFFLFVEGKAATPSVSKVLESIPGVKVIYRTKELEEKQANSRIWNETWLSSFFYKPCNYELFVKQSLNMEMAILMARYKRYTVSYHATLLENYEKHPQPMLVTQEINGSDLMMLPSLQLRQIKSYMTKAYILFYKTV